MPNKRPAPADIKLSMYDGDLDDMTTMKALNKYKDKLIIFRATQLGNEDQDSDHDEADLGYGSNHDDDSEGMNDEETEAKEYFTVADQDLLEGQDQDAIQFDSAYMNNISDITSVQRLDTIVRQGLKQVALLENLLQQDSEHPDVQIWLKKIDDLKEKARYQRTIVGIVGCR